LHHVLERLPRATEGLSTFPGRASCPKELRSLGIAEYRRVFFKPCRLIYRVLAQQGDRVTKGGMPKGDRSRLREVPPGLHSRRA